VLESVVPVAHKIIMENGARIGIENPKFYDQSLEFLDGNPTPKGTKDELVGKALRMYSEMSPETKEFFEFMCEHELLDVESKPGKANGGYCTYIDGYKSPFIFANFNGTSGDVDVLTHEAGHAFMAYCSKDTVENPDLLWPTSEACEIHSMSMEFLAWPWMELFFGDAADKYRFSHLEHAITFLPYGVAIDEFQHAVYANPEMTHEERCAKWREIEKKYLPLKKYTGFSYYNKGTWWMKQSHLFGSPFYYIDYTLAQVCAFQFHNENMKNHEKTWKKYTKLCKMGGKYPFLTLLEKANLRNPFEDGNVKKAIKPLVKLLNSFDDKNM
jgi:M3 family oligoendopeptidase